MNVEKVNLIIKNMELLIEALKEEVTIDSKVMQKPYRIDDYDEVFEDFED